MSFPYSIPAGFPGFSLPSVGFTPSQVVAIRAAFHAQFNCISRTKVFTIPMRLLEDLV